MLDCSEGLQNVRLCGIVSIVFGKSVTNGIINAYLCKLNTRELN